MTAIIIAVFLILIVLVYTFISLKDVTVFIANKLIDINNNLENVIELLTKLNKK